MRWQTPAWRGAPGAVQTQAVGLAGFHHLRGQLAGRCEAGFFDSRGDGGLINEHKVVFKTGDLVGVHHGDLAKSLLVKGHTHTGGVLVHAPEGHPAEDLVTWSHRGQPETGGFKPTTASPGARSDDLLHDIEGSGGGVGIVPGVELALEPSIAIGEQAPHARDLPKEGGKLGL